MMTWILDRLPVGVWVGVVPGGEAFYANHAFQEILGIAPVKESRISDSVDTYGVRDEAGRPFPLERMPFSRVVASGRSVVVEGIVIHRPDGARVPIRAFGTPLHDEAGALSHVCVTFQDISQELAERARAHSVERQLSYALEHAPIAIWATDRDGRVTMSQGAGLRPLGIASGQLVGKSLFDLYADHQDIVASIRRALDGEAHWYAVDVGGAVFDTYISPMRDADGAITGVLGLSNDVTELRRLEARTLHDDRVMTMGTLAASVAHEINNPLTYMLKHLADAHESVLRAEREGGLDLAVLSRRLQIVREGAERIAVITSELRTFGREDDALETVSVRDAVVSVLALMRKEVESRATLFVDLGTAPAARGSNARLVQVVMNLLLNALQALSGSPVGQRRIELRCGAGAGGAIIEVADNGPGIRPTDKDRIFEPFFSTKPVGDGTGLGLFVSRNVVRAMGGTLVVEDRPGGGAVFRVWLPEAGRFEVAPAAPVATEERTAVGAATALVVDDEPEVAKVVAARLRAVGCRVEVFHEAGPALARLESGPPVDLVLCDLMMKGMTGMQLGLRLEESRPEQAARVVYMTGGAFTPEAQAFVRSHASQCVDKPFDVAKEAMSRLRVFVQQR